MEISDFISGCSSMQAAIIKMLPDKMMDVPGVTLKWRYKLPFFYRHSWICYLNPLKSGGVELCFTKGYLLSNDNGLLNANGRTMISGVVYANPGDVNIATFLETFLEALIADEATVPKKRK